jgi:hypothetical protein
MNVMKHQILDNWAAVNALAPEWNALLERSRANTIFLTWEWIAAWRETAGRDAQPFVVALRDDEGALVGIAPFYRTTLSLMGVMPFSALRILGDYPTGAEYGDWIVRTDREAEATAALSQALAGAGRAWDCIWMPKVSGWTGASDALAKATAVALAAQRLRLHPAAGNRRRVPQVPVRKQTAAASRRDQARQRA